jgi:hypothetical protein
LVLVVVAVKGQVLVAVVVQAVLEQVLLML